MKYVFVIVLFYLFFCWFTSMDRVCDDSGIIVDIGGCNSTGRCGVRLSDGHFKDAYTPVKGQNYCFEFSHKLNWKWLGFQ